MFQVIRGLKDRNFTIKKFEAERKANTFAFQGVKSKGFYL